MEYKSDYFDGFKSADDSARARKNLVKFADLVVVLNDLNSRDGFVEDFYKKIPTKLGKEVDLKNIHLSKESYSTIEVEIGNKGRITLNMIATMLNPAGPSSKENYKFVAAAFNNLYSGDIKYFISQNWDLKPLTSSDNHVHQGASPDTILTTSEPDPRIISLEYEGKWQGVHFYSRDSRHSREEMRFLRRISVEIFGSGEAKLQYLNHRGAMEEIPTLGKVSVGYTGEQLFIEFTYDLFKDAKETYKVRAMYGLIRKQNDHKHLLGSYAGFSPTNETPYGGAISLRKLEEKETSQIKNIEPAKQSYQLWEEADLASLQEAYEHYLETPEKSLSRELHALFRKYTLKKADFQGDFITIGIGSGGSDSRDLNMLVSYPMKFKDGLCITHWALNRPDMTSPVRSIGEREKHIWMHLRDANRLTNISYYIDDSEHPEFKGVSYRLNANNKLQARTEILIRKAKLDPDECVLKKYRFGDESYNKLKKEYYETHPFFRELIDSFEKMVNGDSISNHILQNRATPQAISGGRKGTAKGLSKGRSSTSKPAQTGGAVSGLKGTKSLSNKVPTEGKTKTSEMPKKGAVQELRKKP